MDDEDHVVAQEQRLVEEAIESGQRLVDALPAQIDRGGRRARVRPPRVRAIDERDLRRRRRCGLVLRGRLRRAGVAVGVDQHVGDVDQRVHRAELHGELALVGRRGHHAAAAQARHDHRRTHHQLAVARGAARRQGRPRLVARHRRAHRDQLPPRLLHVLARRALLAPQLDPHPLGLGPGLAQRAQRLAVAARVLAIAALAGLVAIELRRDALGLHRLELGEQRRPLLFEPAPLIGHRRQELLDAHADVPDQRDRTIDHLGR